MSLFHNYLPLEKGRGLLLNKLESTSPKDALCQVLLKIGPVVLKIKSLNLSMYFYFFVFISLEKDRSPHLSTLESPLPKDVLCQFWLKFAQWFWRSRFLNFVNVFLLFLNFLPLERVWTFVWTNKDSHHQRMLFTKFDCHWSSGPEEEDENVKSLWRSVQWTTGDQKSSLWLRWAKTKPVKKSVDV